MQVQTWALRDHISRSAMAVNSIRYLTEPYTCRGCSCQWHSNPFRRILFDVATQRAGALDLYTTMNDGAFADLSTSQSLRYASPPLPVSLFAIFFQWANAREEPRESTPP